MTSLFRQEVFTAKRNTWLGEIVLIRPTSFAFLTCVTALIVAVMLGYLFWGEYTRKAKAIGYIVPNAGLIKVAPQQAGIVSELRVREGQSVNQGDILAILNTERATANGDAQAEISKQQTANSKQLSARCYERHLAQALQLLAAGSGVAFSDS
jgi:membrane fusion protein